MVSVKIWYAKEGIFKIDLASNVSIDASGPIDADFGTGSAVAGVYKDLRITLSQPDVDQINLVGSDTAGFQNAELEEKPPVLTEMSGTLVLPGDEGVEEFFFDAGTVVAGGYTRYQPGKSSVRKLAFLINLTDGTDVVNIAMDNMVGTSGEIRLTGADGHWETSYSGKCLARDAFIEFKD